MKILVTGYGGQLGYDVVREGLNRDLEIIGANRSDLDITSEDNVRDFVNKINPDAIIHCAAYTAVDKAEEEKELCWDVNVQGTRNLVEAARSNNAKFLYISTDYVFDGKGEKPFFETDIPNPISYYGRTKYEGEKIVQELLKNWFIVRISWVFGINGQNFIKTMLRLSESNDQLNIVNDQYGSPTYTFHLASLLLDIVHSDKYGLYHATNEGICSWAEFAMEIFRQSSKSTRVNPITTAEYPTRAVRPANSRMSKQKLIDNGFKPLPKWQDAIKDYLTELTQEVE
ncbi:dTDP-4-dehydrorhamnose reductase [Bacillus oleivorans]|uniref:dTDP-4-dehydrorhamnose reductase n=1 Tax=Bacillus oleivorans TaxID=1448271 RepID=A0A285CHM2_9BACI|nr:dTDP-4-dehydrorhamnose reductase [Bacillus oleivorans]SNX67091.1 dTDP-4-dehydrorhamnose reductase [Bacillus oleivorans]